MYRRFLFIVCLVLFSTFAGPVAADTEGRWFGEIQGIALQELDLADAEITPAVGLTLGYRINDRVGLSLAVADGTVESESEIDFFGFFEITNEIEIDVTPVLLELDFHLTPGRRADLVLGPIVGYGFYGDLTNRVTTSDPATSTIGEVTIPTDDGFIWGGQLGLDIDLGASGKSYLSLGARYLQAELEVDIPGEGASVGDLDLLLLHIGFGYRF